MLIHPGTQDRVIAEATLGAGVTSREGSIQSDAILVTLYVDSISSGDLTVVVNTLTDAGKEVDIVTFPTVGAPTVELLLRKSAISMQRFRVIATYSGICNYEVYVRAISSGETSARILGAVGWSVSQTTVTAAAGVLITATLNDRSGVLVKHWGTADNLFLAETLLKATSGIGYPLAPRDAVAMDVAAGAAVYAVSDGGPIDVRIIQAGG